MNIIRSATVTVEDVAVAASNYERWFGYHSIESGLIETDLARSWAAPGCAGQPYQLLQPSSGTDIYIRLVEGQRSSSDELVRTFGWSAMEICVADVFATNEGLQRSPFTVIGPPKPMESLPTIHPMQVRAPDGELSFLTAILDRKIGNGLPRPAVPIDHIFIMVMGCSNADSTYDWFERQLSVEQRMTLEMSQRILNNAFGLPLSNKTRMRTAKANGLVCLEFDTLPASASRRRQPERSLPSGIGLVSVIHPALDRIPGPWIETPAVRQGRHYGGSRAGTLVAPDGVLVEVVECGRSWPG